MIGASARRDGKAEEAVGRGVEVMGSIERPYQTTLHIKHTGEHFVTPKGSSACICLERDVPMHFPIHWFHSPSSPTHPTTLSRCAVKLACERAAFSRGRLLRRNDSVMLQAGVLAAVLADALAAALAATPAASPNGNLSVQAERPQWSSILTHELQVPWMVKTLACEPSDFDAVGCRPRPTLEVPIVKSWLGRPVNIAFL